jgi:hypothetical protein
VLRIAEEGGELFVGLEVGGELFGQEVEHAAVLGSGMIKSLRVGEDR